MEEFDIYISGFLPEHAESADAGLVRVFGLDPQRAREFVQSLPRVVKRQVDVEHVARYARVLDELGAVFELRRSPIRPAQVIAVQGGPPEPTAGADPELHGGTLTLPPPSSAFDAPLHGPGGAQFAQTIVERGLPASLLAEIEAAEARAAAAEAAPLAMPAAVEPVFHAPPSAPEPTPWHEVPVRRRSSRPPPGSGTLREGHPSLIAASVPAPVPASIAVASPPPSAALPLQVPSPPAVAAPQAAFALPPLAAVWHTPEPFRSAAVPDARAARADAPPPSPLAAHEPPDIGGRPGWLIDGALMNRQGVLDAPPGSAPSLSHGEHAPMSRRPRRPLSAPAQAGIGFEDGFGAPPAPSPRAAASVGHAFGQASEDQPLPPLALRVVLRIGLGVSLFVCISALRHALDSDITRAIAAWGDAPVAGRYTPQSFVTQNSRSRPAPGQPALEWMQSDLHYFTNPDKEAVRRRVKAFKAAGAAEVYVGNIMHSGPMHIADELLVELPDDEDQRRAIMAEYERGLHSTFGGFTPRANKPIGSILRVTP